MPSITGLCLSLPLIYSFRCPNLRFTFAVSRCSQLQGLWVVLLQVGESVLASKFDQQTAFLLRVIQVCFLTLHVYACGDDEVVTVTVA